MKLKVICVPGSVAPAAQRYGPLKKQVEEVADLQLKDLEVYREDTPPPTYAIEEEIEAIDRFADAIGIDRFHLAGYSGGGFVSLAYAGMRPDRLLSLALFEAARIPGSLTDPEQAFFSTLESKLRGLEGDRFMETFVREQVKPGVQVSPPPPGPISPEMRKRPAGIAAMIRAFDAYAFDRSRLAHGHFPVYYGYGDLSHPEQALKAGVLAQLFADIHVQRFAGVHHFVPPEQIYTEAHAGSLIDLWRKGEAGSAAELSLKK